MTVNPLQELIKDKITRTGPINFAEFMDLALYHEQWGYYTQNARVGCQGDFYTSPHVNLVFGRMLARQLQEMWLAAGAPGEWVLLEYGPGEGILSRDILLTLKDQYPDFYHTASYRLLEKSDAMAKRQRCLLSDCGLLEIDIKWVKDLKQISPAPFQGCVFSNELVDAFPVHLVKQTPAGLKEFYVTLDNGELAFLPGKPSSEKIAEYFSVQGITLEQDQVAEVNLKALDWLKAVAEHLSRGYVLTIDYGTRAEELYSPARFGGTLRCFYRHRLDSSPLEHVGKKDITASVNFTALEIWGKKFGLNCLGITTQSRFLINLGIFEELKQDKEFTYDPSLVKKTMAIKQLVMPEGMGNVFKVLIQYLRFDVPPRLTGLK